MATPSPRNSIRIARGLYADLLASVADLGAGELCYGLDHDKFYTPDGQGGLAEVGRGTAIATLGQVEDVDLAGLQSGQVLKWNGSAWVPGNDSGAVSSVAGKTGDVTLVVADITDFDASDYATAAQGVKADSAVQPGDLATVATTGSYDDLTDKPAPFDPGTLATVATTGDYDDLINKPAPFDPGTLATVATTGSYDDLTDKPAIPSATSDLTNDSGFITDAGVTQIIAGNNITIDPVGGDGVVTIGSTANSVVISDLPVLP